MESEIGKKDAGDCFEIAQPANLMHWMEESQANQLYIQLKAVDLQ